MCFGLGREQDMRIRPFLNQSRNHTHIAAPENLYLKTDIEAIEQVIFQASVTERYHARYQRSAHQRLTAGAIPSRGKIGRTWY
jgi:hypothetical protein